MKTTSFFTLNKFLKSSRGYDQRTVFQTEIQRFLHQYKTISNVENDDPSELQEIIPGQITEQHFNCRFPLQTAETISYGTVDELIGLSCMKFEVFRDFIWGHRLFVSTREVLKLFLDRFELAVSIDSERANIVRARIVSILSYWSTTIYPILPEHEKKGASMIFSLFVRRINCYGMKKQARLLLEHMQREKTVVTVVDDCDDTTSYIKEPFKYFVQQTHIDFIDIPPVEFAKQLTLISSEYFRAVGLFELQLWNSCRDECHALAKCVNFFNTLQNYLALLLLREKSVIQRSKILSHIISICNYCYIIKNYDAVVCIITLLDTSSIHRLKKTFTALPGSIQTKLSLLRTFASPKDNWAFYRKKVNEAKHTACVPYVGLFSSDTLFATDGIKTETNDNQINFLKCQKLSGIAQQVAFLQQRSYSFKKCNSIRKFIFKCVEEPVINEENKFSMSRSIEPAVGKEQILCIKNDKELKQGTSLIRFLCYQTTQVVMYSVNNEMTINDFFNYFDDLTEHKAVIVSQSEIQIIDRSTPIDILVRRYMKADSILTAWKQLNPLHIRYVQSEVLVPIDNTLTLSQIQPILNTIFKLDNTTHTFIHLLRNTTERFLHQSTVISTFVCSNTVLLVLPHNLITPTIQPLVLSSHKLQTFNVSALNDTLQIIDVSPFLILQFPEKHYTVSRVTSHFVFIPSLQELLFASIETDFTPSTPLVITGDVTILRQLVTLYHQPECLCGISTEQLDVVENGIHPLLYNICHSLYLHDDFNDTLFFSNVDISAAASVLRSCEFGEDIIISELPSPQIIGMLLLYFTSLGSPLIPLTKEDIKLIEQTDLSLENTVKTIDRLLRSLQGTRALTTVHMILHLFHSWIQPNPTQVNNLAHFSKFFFTGLSPELQLFLFNNSVEHINLLRFPPLINGRVISQPPKSLPVDYILNVFFGNVQYKQYTLNIVEGKVITNVQPEFRRNKPYDSHSPRNRGFIQIGERKNGSPRTLTTSSTNPM
ncbi:Guanine nucleotide exchange factor [Entamoeba marina]